MSEIATTHVSRAPIPSHAELFLAFFRITLSGFGGTLPWTRRMFVEKKRWMTAEEFNEAYAFCQFLPGPNIVAYYFAFRVMGHWLSMRGASQGLHGIAWTGRPCEPLTELREVASLHGAAREQRVHEIAARLRLQHLSTFFERVAVRHA